ncbi:hypothetical protein V1520DRAFT_368125 [Lipomyces starkeyi]|uniref:Uncharacterized protein n=1 Tax=Lipomyces starkeyi NRRL Y-11557 TaxID=675824 RepID=A0A1E3Q4J2_LIPST|nr:hypothetical protein LIPSTDRAFT_72200 [Lipomyces starkeyi NRRL Y-11557]
MVFSKTRMAVRKSLPLIKILRRDSKVESARPSAQNDDVNEGHTADVASGQGEAATDATSEVRPFATFTCRTDDEQVDCTATVTQNDMLEYIFDELEIQAVETEAGETLDEIMPDSANPQTADTTYQPHISSDVSLDSPGDIDAFFSPRLIYPVLIVGALTALALVISSVYLFSSIESRMHAPVIRLYNDNIHLGIRGLVGGGAKFDYISTGFFCLVFYGTLLWFAIMTHREVVGRRAGDSVTMESATLGNG